MVSIRSPHKLPGENGMHSRDGSLTKRKKEQWERERAENEQSGGWFSKFGQKHTPGRRRAWATTATTTANENAPAENEQRQSDGDGGTAMQQNNGSNEQQANSRPIGVAAPPPIDRPPSPLVHLPPAMPPAMFYGTPSAFPLQAPSAPVHFFAAPSPAAVQPILFGEYQAQCQRQFISGPMPMFPQFAPPPQTIDTAAFLLAAHQQQQKFPLGLAPHPLMPTPPVSCPSSVEEAGGNSSPAEQTHQQHNVCHVDIVEHHQQQQHYHNSNNGSHSTLLCPQSSPGTDNSKNKMASPNANCVRFARRSLSMDASGTWEEELARQVAERKMSAEREAQKALEEERMREREERERLVREEAEREAEERRRMDRIEARDQTERSTLASLQRAQREAELLRRAKLFRHILLDGDGQADMDTAREVLKCGPDEAALLNDVIRQLRDFDRQKRLANESCGSLSPSTGKATPKSAKETTKMAGGKTTPPTAFSRANSWNVKHSRTMGTDFSPPPIVEGQQPKIAAAHGTSATTHPSSKKMAKTAADRERQNATVTPKANLAETSAFSAQYPQQRNNYGSPTASAVSPGGTASSAGGGPEKSTPPDKKSFRQKVQSAVRNGAAAMLRRRESTGKTPTTTTPNGGGTPKVLRTVGLFEQVTLRHRTTSTSSSNKQKQSEQQKVDQQRLSKNTPPNNKPPTEAPSPPDSAESNGTPPIPFDRPSHAPPLRLPLSKTPSQPPAAGRLDGTPSLYSAQTVEFLLPPPPPVASSDRCRRRQQNFEAIKTAEAMTLKPIVTEELEMKQQKQKQQRHLLKMGQSEGEEEEANEYSEENSSSEENGPKATAKCQQRRENGIGALTHFANGTGKAMAQPSPPGSSATSSSSASVLRFRAALDSPFGSREDISNSLTSVSNGNNGYAAFPPAPPRFLGGPLRHTNGAIGGAFPGAHSSHFLAPPSPFRRAPCAGDNSEPLLRRSLRSPTMRRLQESLQSLAEDVPMSPAAAPIVGARGDAGRAETPKPFNCRTSQYRSLNLKRDTERQKQILGHLAQVRAQLKNSQVQIERTISEKQQQNLA